MGHYGMGYGGTGFMGGGIFSMLLMVLFWVLVIAVVFFLVRWIIESVSAGGASAGRKQAAEAPGNALEIVQMRYAKGEITREEFLEMKKDLA